MMIKIGISISILKEAGKYVFVPEKLDADSERERVKAENDSISFDDPSLEDFFGYNLKADEARFDKVKHRRLQCQPDNREEKRNVC